jgi:phosphoglycolate phosphatase-like HAD superfamily hydrolase
MTALAVVRAARLVFWDFDGVIKDSVDVKTRAFVRLFEPYGSEAAARVRAHHEAHGGMSRFDKIPLYLRFVGMEPTESHVRALTEQFAALVEREVIEAPWVPGVEEYLRRHADEQVFVLVSATPQDEIERIVLGTGLSGLFADVIGAPTGKEEAVRLALHRHGVAAADSVFVGDATADLAAASSAGVRFVLRRHATNAAVFEGYSGPAFHELR